MGALSNTTLDKQDIQTIQKLLEAVSWTYSLQQNSIPSFPCSRAPFFSQWSIKIIRKTIKSTGPMYQLQNKISFPNIHHLSRWINLTTASNFRCLQEIIKKSGISPRSKLSFQSIYVFTKNLFCNILQSFAAC